MSIDLFWLLGSNALLIPSPVIAAIFCASDDPSILSQYAKLETLHNPRHDDKGGLARRWRQPADGQESHEVGKTQHAMERRERRSYFGRSADCFMSPNKMTLRAPKGSSSTLPACGLRVWSTQLKIPAMAFQASVSIIPVSWKITLELNIEWGWC